MSELGMSGRPDGGGAISVTAIDIRTSSFDAAAGAVIGISAMRIAGEGENPDGAFDWELPAGAAGTPEDEELRRQLDAFGPVLPDLGPYLEGSRVVAHGAAWARTSLRKATLAVGADWVPPSILCTRRMARACFPDLDSYGLSALVDILSLAPERPQDGAERCRAVAELYRLCLGRLGNSGSDLSPYIVGPGAGLR